MSRKHARKEAMFSLYQMDVNNKFYFEVQKNSLKEKVTDIHELHYVKGIIENFINEREIIDNHIVTNLKKWNINRLPKVDLAILRLAITEFFYADDIPIEVSVNEAVEMAKEYSDKDSAKFINGVLGGVIQKGNLINE
ncbi:transcription antitermination factor NusB [Clostridiaceae bacterium HSG29]|nr:transcription antitermination factor NusB [Clostridiaceae bacterium HSG29]